MSHPYTVWALGWDSSHCDLDGLLVAFVASDLEGQQACFINKGQQVLGQLD
jgi:hypothetical protein